MPFPAGMTRGCDAAAEPKSAGDFVEQDCLDIDEATWLRSRAWALSQACLQLPYYHETNRPLAAQARYVISEVLADAATA
jgi:aminoglycoside phosphotransferase (APT) family kinase protein